jgi:DDE superfamily endonuclease
MASTKNDPHPHGPHVITYSATLDVPEATAVLLTDLLIAERRRRGTGIGARAASAREQAILVLRWFRQDADMLTLARDTGVLQATGYRYLHEGIDVLAGQAPELHQVLAAGRAAGWSHVTLDGTLITTDRCRTVNPDTGHDLWYSGKHRAHGGNVQVVCDPTGFPVAVSDVQPGSTHDLAAARVTGFLAALHAAAALLGLVALADKGYDGAGIGVQTPAKGGNLAPSTACRNRLLTRLRAEGERGIALLKTRWKALRRIRLCPQRIGAIVAAALVLTTAERPIR